MTNTPTGSWINDRTVYLSFNLIDYDSRSIKPAVITWLSNNAPGWNYSYYSAHPNEKQFILAFREASHAIHFKLRWENVSSKEDLEWEVDCDICYF